MPLMFEQQPRESDKAFAAFKTYLELGPQRSLVRTASKLGKFRTLMERWSKKYDWPARVQAHAAHLAEIERKAAEAVATRNGVDWAKRQEQQREEEWESRCELIALAREAIGRWKKNEARCGTLEGIARLLDLASRLGRVSSGLPLQPVEELVEQDSAFMIQIEVALDKIYGAEAPAPSVAAPSSVVDVESKPVNPPAALPAQT